MKIKRSDVVLAVVILVFGFVWVKGFWFTEVFHTHQRNEPDRAALLKIYEAVEMGASHADVLAAYWSFSTDSLRLFAESPTHWHITMQAELGAGDWRLQIEYQDGKVTAVRVRTSDGPPPKGGPQDKQKEAG